MEHAKSAEKQKTTQNLNQLLTGCKTDKYLNTKSSQTLDLITLNLLPLVSQTISIQIFPSINHNLLNNSNEKIFFAGICLMNLLLISFGLAILILVIFSLVDLLYYCVKEKSRKLLQITLNGNNGRFQIVCASKK